MLDEHKQPHMVFVYGSLMRGLSNHGLLADRPSEQGTFNKRVNYISVASVRLPDHKMVAFGRSFPAIVPEEGAGPCVVMGELYKVRASVLDDLDRLEGHPTFYRRIKTQVEIPPHEKGVPHYIAGRRLLLHPGRRVYATAWVYYLEDPQHASGVVRPAIAATGLGPTIYDWRLFLHEGRIEHDRA